MARTVLPLVLVSRFVTTGLSAAPPAADPANGNACFNDGGTVLLVTNTDSSTHPLSVAVVAGIDGLVSSVRSWTLPVSALVQVVGPFPVQFYGPNLLINTDSTLVKIQPVSLVTTL